MGAHTFTFPDVPIEFSWVVPPLHWEVGLNGDLSVSAGAETDLFVDPAFADPTRPVLNAPRAVGSVEGDFQLSARVEVHHRSTFDAGVLVVWVDDANWGKLCFEYSPQRQPMLVSVVTRGTSDDCNAFVVDGVAVWLRVSRSGQTFALHASTDGRSWRLVRYFRLDAGPSVQVGFEAQSPAGDGCSATFSQIRFAPRPVADIRDGN